MSADDLQVGNTWTDPAHRNRGIATFAIQKILELQKKPLRDFWYVVEENNIPSIRVIENAGFTKVGEGIRTKRFGAKAFGAYVIQAHVNRGLNSHRNLNVSND
jgi:RimJ/RimL family protein N-acetyltransferase